MVEAVITVAAVLAAVQEQRMYQSVKALAVLAVAPVASQIWKLLEAAAASRPARVVGVQAKASVQVELSLVPVLKVGVRTAVAEATEIAEYA